MSITQMSRRAVLTLLVAGLVGCGGGGGGGGGGSTSNLGVNASSAATPCINCHGAMASRVTGNNVVAEWRESGHNASVGASCGDCHEPAPGHPNSCNLCHNGPGVPSRDEVVRNPDAAGKCDKCHGPGMPFQLQRNHYADTSAVPLPLPDDADTVAWVTPETANKCRLCHNPHNVTVTQYHRDWAASAHGDVNGPAWQHYDFKFRALSYGSPATDTFATRAMPAGQTAGECVRCHSTTGYLNFIASGNTSVAPWASTTDKTKQTLYCNACHTDYAFAVRGVPAGVGYYNYSAASTRKFTVNFQFPDLGRSNLCMYCHVGREAGATIVGAAQGPAGTYTGFTVNFRGNWAALNFGNVNFINSHYLSAGATVFGVSGYEYAGQNYNNPAYYKHDKIGLNNYSDTGTSGPCVTCHLVGGRHTFKPFSYNGEQITSVSNPVCVKCHTGAHGPALAVGSQAAADFLNTEKEDFEYALAALECAFKYRDVAAPAVNTHFFFSEAYPYFYRDTNNNHVLDPAEKNGGNAFKDWDMTANTVAFGANTMGAAFNYNLLKHDPGAYAHNRIYAKRLIYDSISWLIYGNLIGSIVNAIDNLPAGATYTSNGNQVPFDAAKREAAITYLTGGRANPARP